MHVEVALSLSLSPSLSLSLSPLLLYIQLSSVTQCAIVFNDSYTVQQITVCACMYFVIHV